MSKNKQIGPAECGLFWQKYSINQMKIPAMSLKLVQIKELAQQTINTTNPDIIDANQKQIGGLVDQISADIDNLILQVEQVSQALKSQLES